MKQLAKCIFSGSIASLAEKWLAIQPLNNTNDKKKKNNDDDDDVDDNDNDNDNHNHNDNNNNNNNHFLTLGWKKQLPHSEPVKTHRKSGKCSTLSHLLIN